MFAVILVLGLTALAIVHSGRRDKAIHVLASGRVPALSHPDSQYVKRLKTIQALVRIGKPVPTALVDDVIAEAYDRGDWKVITALSRGGEGVGAASEAPAETSEAAEGPAMDASKPIDESPIDGASGDEWSEFLDKLKTGGSGSANHVGEYHHNIERLSRLGIDPTTLKSEGEQRAALSRDLTEYRQAERKLIDDFGGDLLEINGQTHPITMSGVLGVLKSAGSKHARSWFKNADDREAFTHTTETFLRTNGIF